MENFSIGARIKQLRKKNNLTLQDVAAMLKTSQGFLSEVERDKKIPGSEFLLKFREHFGVDLNWLFTGKGSPYPIGQEYPKPTERIPQVAKEELLYELACQLSDEELVRIPQIAQERPRYEFVCQLSDKELERIPQVAEEGPLCDSIERRSIHKIPFMAEFIWKVLSLPPDKQVLVMGAAMTAAETYIAAQHRECPEVPKKSVNT